jgi:G patch domain-containing protein 1
LSASQEYRQGPSASADQPPTTDSVEDRLRCVKAEDDAAQEGDGDGDGDGDIIGRQRSPPPRYPYPASDAPASTSFSLASPRPGPPPFSSLYEYSSVEDLADHHFRLPGPVLATSSGAGASSAAAAPAYAPLASGSSASSGENLAGTSGNYHDTVAETKRALPQDSKPESAGQKVEEPSEPPPAYTEGYSPLLSFTYLMAAAGGASSIITQVQQGGPPINAIGDVGADETITMDLRGTRFVLSRDELLTLPEFVLLSLFPNGLFPEGHMGGFAEGDAVHVDYDPASLQYMLDFFRNVAQSIPNEASPNASPDGGVVPIDSLGGRGEDGSKRAGIIVLREDLDFYAIPPRPDISQAEMIEVKRAAARALLRQDGIFSGLKRSDEPGTTEAHLIEMLTAGGFNHDDRWGHRAGEPNKAVVCSLALARLRSDIKGNDVGNNAVGMAQKLLLFWRKPARRCWWEGVDLDDVEGVNGPLKVWIRRVWTLEMSVIGLR